MAHPAALRSLTARDVAVLIPAHNEAAVIGDSLRAIMALVPRQNVHVVSDGSTDETPKIARQAGVKVSGPARTSAKRARCPRPSSVSG